MPYQIREFHILFGYQNKKDNQLINSFGNQHSFPDIYVFKQGSVHIGVKFRDIKTKKYGYKINSVQIKIDKETLNSKASKENELADPHLLFYQKWKKHEVDFKYKLMKPSLFQDSNELQRLKKKEIEKAQWKNDKPHYQKQINMKYQSFEAQLQHLNIELTYTLKTHLSQKSSFKSQMFQNNFITQWLVEQNPIKQLFVIFKNKCKTHSWESGKILVQTFSGKMFQLKDHKDKIQQLKNLLIQTFSQEDNKKSFIQAKIDSLYLKNYSKTQQKQLTFQQIYNLSDQEQNLINKHKSQQKYKHNTSYPQLLQDLYQFCIINQ